MNNIPTTIWTFLPVSDILNLRIINKFCYDVFSNICVKPYAWRYLLKRDFNIVYNANDCHNEYGRTLLKILAQKSYMLSNTDGCSYEQRCYDAQRSAEFLGVFMTGSEMTKIFGVSLSKRFTDGIMEDLLENDLVGRTYFYAYQECSNSDVFALMGLGYKE